jgi:uncharacterized protein (TIGR02145 family)
MKKLFTILAAVLLTASVFAQAPQKMSYQALVRDASGALVTSTAVGMQLSILQGSPTGTAVYTETQTPNTNINGLVSLEIGTGTTTDDFSTIDWTAGPYFIKTETDPTGGTAYSIAGTNELMSAPYALHSKTAESVTGTITEIDPTFTSSQAANITTADITKLSNLSGTNTGDQDISGIATNATAISTIQSEQTAQNTAIALNTANTGITTAQANAIIANTGKDTTAIDHANRTALNAVSGANTGDQDISGIATNATAISTIQSEQTTQNTAIALNTAKTGITTAQANAIIANTGKDTTAIYHANRTALNAVSGANTGDQDISGIETNATAITTGLALKVDKETGKGLVANGTVAGQMQYWNGTAWVTVAATVNEGATLQLIGGIPAWAGGTPSVANPTTGKVWMDRNLGASQVATSSTDPDSYGDLYQWGRAADGHQIRTSGTTITLSAVDQPAHGDFILAPSFPHDWLSPQNTDLWQGVSGENNPCPSTYRLPTDAELNAERVSWGTNNNAAGAFASPLKLPLAGSRSRTSGLVIDVGTFGHYWSSTFFNTGSLLLGFTSNGAGNAAMAGNDRSNGFSVRCIKD